MTNENKLETALFPIRSDLKRFEEKLYNLIENNECFLKEDVQKFIFQNPKRLRPAFVYLFSKIFEIDDEKNVDNIALASEIIHSASLIHDDILDEEKIRRNNPTFYSKFGANIAVLEGDYFLSLALEVLSNTNLNILKIFSKRIKKTILGELEQNINTNSIMGIETYFKKTIEKTGNLFFAGLESLFVLNNSKTYETNEKLMGFLQNYTLAFQLKNDIDNILKNNSSDIKNGNYTLPVIYFCMDNSVDSLSEISKEKIEKYINLSCQKVKEYKNIALDFIHKIADTQYKKALIELCEVTLEI